MKHAKNVRQPINRRLPLADLIARRDNSTVMSNRARKALARQISHHGCYPALVVRKHPDHAGKYEILDGRHRAEILREFGHETARCEIWPVDPPQAEIAAATLNRLRGRQDVSRRAGQIRRIVERVGDGVAARILGVTPKAIRQQLAAGEKPAQSIPAPALDLEPVVFHLSSEQADTLRKALKEVGGGGLGRGKALMKAIANRRDYGDIA